MNLTEQGPQHYLLMRSEDDGRTWSPPVDTPTGQHAGPTVLADGRLLYVNDQIEKGQAIVVWASSDKGDTWEKIGDIPISEEAKGLSLGEAHSAETSSENLVVLFRSGSGDWEDQYLCQSNSRDAGRTWSEIKRLPVWGFPPHLTLLHSRALLCTYSHRRDPMSIRAVLSYDEGETWDHENIITLYELSADHDFGYPVSVETAPGEIVTVFYINKKYVSVNDRMIHLPYVEDAGGIMSVRWTLK
jgi:hypothetical protein